MKIKEVVQTLIPQGTASRFAVFVGDEPAVGALTDLVDWALCPAWPPDLFAVVATLVERSSCYTFAGPSPRAIADHVRYLDEVERLSRTWTTLSNVPPEVDAMWKELVIASGSIEIARICREPSIIGLLLKLFAIADETCRGMGWSVSLDPAIGGSEIGIADLAHTSLLRGREEKSSAPYLPFTPISLCSLVPHDVAIVLPKSMTASVGCTVRSLSHHLALLPGSTQIEPSWRVADSQEPRPPETMRLLIIPFPFTIPDDSFSLSREPVSLGDNLFTAGYFKLEQKWLSAGDRDITAKEIVDEIVLPLILKAKKQSRNQPVDGVLMPECALSRELGSDVADLLAAEGVQFFITGALETDDEGRTRNIALTHVVARGNDQQGLVTDIQSKHHRWRLDEPQVSRYALTFPDYSTLEPKHAAKQWWEDIDVAGRKLPFYALRRDMSLTVLICEDLARNDPAMNVIRAVGPNLVVALLMDGPQLAVRWPARYATVLADDPGSSVLSITCAAMVDRSNWK